jgi:hypothetical protein
MWIMIGSVVIVSIAGIMGLYIYVRRTYEASHWDNEE